MATITIKDLAREVLGEDLHTWAERHRKDDRSWPWIARKLEELSERRITVTPQHLNELCKKLAAERTAV
jgi:hypothetical protein